MPRVRGAISLFDWLGCSLAAAMLLAAVPAHADTSSDALMRALKVASGGERWDGVAAITAEGQKTSFGLTGEYHSVEDLRSGRFAQRADYKILANAEGLDREGRWRMDNSRQVHPLDSDEAKTVAVTESYLTRRGYLFDRGDQAALTTLAPMAEDQQTFDCVEATPKGGRAAVLWIGRTDHHLDRVVIQLSTVVKTIQYRDYRTVDGLVLPFETQVTNGDQPDTGDAKISDYRLDRDVPEPALQRPSSKVTDASIRSGAPVAYASFALDSRTGFPIVLASINGKGPFPFILDTGGHDILTPAAVSKLGLTTVGQGFSLGAGAGSTPTRFTKVDRLSLGDAELTSSPFAVLDLDLGHAPGPDGEPAPIEGIIGLEVFERFAMTLDYGARRLAIYPLDGFPPRTKALATVPIRFTRDMPLIQASLDGHSGWFGVDTGDNTDPIISGDWAAASGRTAQLGVTEAVAGSGVGGSLDLRKGHAKELDIGGVRLNDLNILLAGANMGSLSSRSEAGTIGETVLSRYSVTFDYRRELMSLEPASPRG